MLFGDLSVIEGRNRLTSECTKVVRMFLRPVQASFLEKEKKVRLRMEKLSRQFRKSGGFQIKSQSENPFPGGRFLPFPGPLAGPGAHLLFRGFPFET